MLKNPFATAFPKNRSRSLTPMTPMSPSASSINYGTPIYTKTPTASIKKTLKIQRGLGKKQKEHKKHKKNVSAKHKTTRQFTKTLKIQRGLGKKQKEHKKHKKNVSAKHKTTRQFTKTLKSVCYYY
jgi:hypothetical protein